MIAFTLSTALRVLVDANTGLRYPGRIARECICCHASPIGSGCSNTRGLVTNRTVSDSVSTPVVRKHEVLLPLNILLINRLGLRPVAPIVTSYRFCHGLPSRSASALTRWQALQQSW